MAIPYLASNRQISLPFRNTFFIIIPSLAAISPSFWWILNDKTVWPWDQAWYGEVSVELWSTWTWRAKEWPWEMVCAQAPKAPGLAWFGQFFVPLGELLGSVELGLMIFILILQLLSLVMIASIGRSFSPQSRWISLAGLMAAASAPIFIGMSHQYMTEAMQCFAVTYFYWIATHSRQRPPMETIAHLFLATGLAMAAKTTSPLYCILPALLACLQVVRLIYRTSHSLKNIELSKWTLSIGTCGILTLLAVAGWYRHNYPGVWQFAKIASSSEIALDYGSRGTFFQKLAYWMEQSAISLSTWWIAWVLLGILVAGSIFYFLYGHHHFSGSRHKDILVLASLGHIILVLLMFSFQINEETRYLLPLLPAAVILLVWSLSQFPRRASTIIPLVVFACLGQWGWVYARAYGFVPPTSLINAWVRPNEPDPGKREEIVRIIHLTSIPQTNRRYNICGIELPWLNANNLAFYASIQGYRLGYRAMYTSLGYAEKDVEKAWTRLQSMNINYYISMEDSQQPEVNFLNKVTLPILMKIQKDPNYKRLEYLSTQGILLFQNMANIP